MCFTNRRGLPLSDANIAVYPLDLSTLTTERYTDPSLQHPIGPLRTVSTPVGNLEEFAKRTGGRLCIAKMDMKNCLKVAAQDASHYYQLAYYADPKGSDGWRKIAVQVSRPDTVVHARNGYYYHRNPKSDPARDLEMKIAVASPLESNAIPIKLRWRDQARNGNKTKVDFDLWMPGSAAGIDSGHENRVDLAIIGLVKGPTGELEDSFEQKFSGDLPDNAVEMIRKQGISSPGTFNVDPGNYLVRFVVRDTQSGKVGTVTAPLTVAK